MNLNRVRFAEVNLSLIGSKRTTEWYLEFDTRYARLSALGVPQVSDKLGRQEKRQKKMRLIYGTGGPKHERVRCKDGDAVKL